MGWRRWFITSAMLERKIASAKNTMYGKYFPSKQITSRVHVHFMKFFPEIITRKDVRDMQRPPTAGEKTG